MFNVNEFYSVCIITVQMISSLKGNAVKQNVQNQKVKYHEKGHDGI